MLVYLLTQLCHHNTQKSSSTVYCNQLPSLDCTYNQCNVRIQHVRGVAVEAA